MEADIKVFDTVDSTNTVLEEMAEEGAREGTCVVAFCQRAGQGRSGRSFYSPPGGNLYMSLLLRPKNIELFNMITVIAAVATVHAIKDILGVGCNIKWVNDIYRDGRKVCGIVAKAANLGCDDEYVILGIGINIYESDDIPADIVGRYGSVMGAGCDMPDDMARQQAVRLSGSIIDHISYYYDTKKLTEAVEDYRKADFVTGRTVEYLSGNKTFTAKAAGIADDGGIILETDGVRKTFRDGEIRIRLCDM